MGKGDPKKPRGKMSSYAFFVQTCREEHKKKHPDASVNFSEFSKKCSERWKTMSAKEKGKFEDMAKADKARYEREMKTYIPPKGETKKKFKDPNAPKRPPSAFFLFCSEYRPKIKGEHPGLSIGDVAKKLGEMWNNTAADDKQPYEKKAAKLKEKYEKDIAAYRAKGKPDAAKKGVVKAEKSKKKKEEEEDEEDEEDEEEEEDEEDEVEDNISKAQADSSSGPCRSTFRNFPGLSLLQNKPDSAPSFSGNLLLTAPLLHFTHALQGAVLGVQLSGCGELQIAPTAAAGGSRPGSQPAAATTGARAGRGPPHALVSSSAEPSTRRADSPVQITAFISFWVHTWGGRAGGEGECAPFSVYHFSSKLPGK
ncbi:PREDICTED: high mobility group protein B1 [Colobus angolensis palliatus]|nr:PREDICTED: high mobility group protein B1 [Colobus angolensis palliatus]